MLLCKHTLILDKTTLLTEQIAIVNSI